MIPFNASSTDENGDEYIIIKWLCIIDYLIIGRCTTGQACIPTLMTTMMMVLLVLIVLMKMTIILIGNEWKAAADNGQARIPSALFCT